MAELHPLAVHFESVVEQYEDGRPEFPPAVVGAICAELGVGPGARVLDLAAGTGKLTRALLAADLDVVAVEPGAKLRERLGASIGSERILAGTAEEIPLEEGSVDLVTASDAFHWFDVPAALAEIRRVLRPAGSPGGLAIIFVGQDWRPAPWGMELAELLGELRGEDHPLWNGPSWRELVLEATGWDGLRELTIKIAAPASRAQILDYLTSFSYVAMLAPDERADAVERAAAVIDGGEIPAELPVRFAISLTRPA